MMIRKLLTTTALASVIATAAFAQATTPATETPAATTTAPATDTMAPAATDTSAAGTSATASSIAYMQSLGAGEYLASVLTGADVYQNDSADAESAGKIDNFLVGNDGKVVAAIIDTAGLDESKVVAVPIDKLTWSTAEGGDEPRAILSASREELVAAPAFTQETAAEAAATAPAAGTGASTTAPAASTAAPAMGTDTAATTPATGTATGTTAPGATADATPMQSTEAGSGVYAATVGGDQFLSEDLIGENVYSGPGSDADSIGSVNDLVMADNGDVKGVVVGVGGFLGIGEKNVGVPFANLQVTKVDGDETRAIVASTKDELTAAPSFNEDAADVADAGAATDTTTAASTGAAGTATGMAAGTAAAPAASSDTAASTATGSAMAPAAPASDMAATSTAPATDTTASTGGAADRSAMTPVTGPELTAESLVGTTVYGPNDESIGEVGDIALSATGTVDAIIVDVGGFLGIGQKPVAVAMDNLQFMKDSGGSMYLYTQFTQDELTNAPEYNSSTYAQNRDQMRIGAGGQIPQSTDTTAPAAGTDAMTPNAAGTTTAPAQ